MLKKLWGISISVTSLQKFMIYLTVSLENLFIRIYFSDFQKDYTCAVIFLFLLEILGLVVQSSCMEMFLKKVKFSSRYSTHEKKFVKCLIYPYLWFWRFHWHNKSFTLKDAGICENFSFLLLLQNYWRQEMFWTILHFTILYQYFFVIICVLRFDVLIQVHMKAFLGRIDLLKGMPRYS